MCTTGAVRVSSTETILFKNKDFARTDLADRLVSTPNVFGIRGVENFGADSKPIYSGLSIGLNRHGVLAADTHVSDRNDADRTYDQLMETGLREGRDAASAIQAMVEAADREPVWWGNIIVADAHGCFAVEVRDREIRAEPVADWSARTNHQLLYDEHGCKHIEGSRLRLAAAQRRLDGARSVDDIDELQHAHDDGETGICRHEKAVTVYAYRLVWRDGTARLDVVKGNPCQNGAFISLEIPLGDEWSPERAQALVAKYPCGILESCEEKGDEGERS